MTKVSSEPSIQFVRSEFRLAMGDGGKLHKVSRPPHFAGDGVITACEIRPCALQHTSLLPQLAVSHPEAWGAPRLGGARLPFR